MSKPSLLEDVLYKQSLGRKLTKRDRKALKDSLRDEQTKAFRANQFPTPVSYYFGDIDYRVSVIKQRHVVEGKLLGKADTTIELEMNREIEGTIKQVYKFYGIKEIKENK